MAGDIAVLVSPLCHIIAYVLSSHIPLQGVTSKNRLSDHIRQTPAPIPWSLCYSFPNERSYRFAAFAPPERLVPSIHR